MKRKNHSPEQIVRMLQQADVTVAQGGTVEQACRELGISEATYYNWRRQYGRMKIEQLKQLKALQKENARLKKLVEAIRRLAKKYPRYGYRLITAKLRQEGWYVNHKRVQRLWAKEGLQVPYKRKRKRSQGSSANSCSVKVPEYINHVWTHVWTYDFIEDRTEDGRKLKFLTVLESIRVSLWRSRSGVRSVPET